jgi:hypothetical protein
MRNDRQVYFSGGFCGPRREFRIRRLSPWQRFVRFLWRPL